MNKGRYKRKVSVAQLLEISKELIKARSEGRGRRIQKVEHSAFKFSNRIKSSARSGFNRTVIRNDKCRVLHD